MMLLGGCGVLLTRLRANPPVFVSAVKRLMKEAQELREPTEQYFAQPLEVCIVLLTGGMYCTLDYG
jgi:hypothetical protein